MYMQFIHAFVALLHRDPMQIFVNERQHHC